MSIQVLAPNSPDYPKSLQHKSQKSQPTLYALQKLDRERLQKPVNSSSDNEISESQMNASPENSSIKATSSEMQARETALAAIDIIRAQAMPLLEAFAQDDTGELIEQLIPHEEDYAQVFIGDAIAAARNAYGNLWSKPHHFQRPDTQQIQILCYLSPAGMLGEDNELSFHFPRGYRAIAPYLNAHRIWMAWKYTLLGEQSGIAFDGLVWIDDHWVWFPKPYKVLRSFLTLDC